METPRARPDAKQAIIRSAFRLFRKQGYGRVSVDVIATEANVTKRTV
jgi:AcrR family transcriptional regulator